MQSEVVKFSEWLLKLGYNELPVKRDASNCMTDCLVTLIYMIHALMQIMWYCAWLMIWVIATEWSHTAGETKIYYSSDDIQTDDDEERAQYPKEFLNCLTLWNASSLKVGAVFMLLHNLNLHKGLCNGTWLLIHNNVIDAKVITGIYSSDNSKNSTFAIRCHLFLIISKFK